MIATLLAVATSLPIEDTADVAAAKAEFNAAFAAAEAGEHAALAPVNSDTQAAQIAAEYLAAAKAAFTAAFDEAAAGGLTAKQAPAPVHEIPAPAPLAAPVVAAGIPYGVSALNVLGGYPYAGLPAAGLPYAGLPAAGLPYAGLPYAGLPYAGLPVIAPAKTE